MNYGYFFDFFLTFMYYNSVNPSQTYCEVGTESHGSKLDSRVAS